VRARRGAAGYEEGMKAFLRENWIWIAAPILLVAALVVALLAFTTDAVSPFDYTL
jgi:hypothetical protein